MPDFSVRRSETPVIVSLMPVIFPEYLGRLKGPAVRPEL